MRFEDRAILGSKRRDPVARTLEEAQEEHLTHEVHGRGVRHPSGFSGHARLVNVSLGRGELASHDGARRS